MLHFDVFKITNRDTDELVGHVTIGLDPDTKNSYSYYYRTPAREYRHLVSLTSMDLSAVVELEESGKLWELVTKKMDRPNIPCYFERLCINKWADSLKMGPNVVAASWFANELAFFEED